MSKLAGVQSIGPLVPLDSNDTYPTHLSAYGKGGWRSVSTILERDNIPVDRLELGMRVFVVDVGKEYKLDSITPSVQWSEYIVGGNGYTLTQIFSSGFSPADNTTYYFSATGCTTSQGTPFLNYIPKSGTIKAVIVSWKAATAGSGEQINCSIRYNNTSNTLIQSVSNTSAMKIFSNYSLSIDVNAGDYFEILFSFPAWATNPLNVTLYATIYIE